MKCVVGLGNPGEKYARNRHNVGFMALDRLTQEMQAGEFGMDRKLKAEIVKTRTAIYAKPQTFMNDSGAAVQAICRFYKVKYQDLYIVHDDLDITLGSYKIQFGKGPQIHNGLLSIEHDLGTDQFWNVRVGVENRNIRGNKGIPGVTYSLQDFGQSELLTVDAVLEQVVKKMVTLL